jgi:hypothetical protein
MRNASVSGALGVSLLVGGILAQSSLATAQQVSPGLDPGFFPATGYRISSPDLLDYFQHRGGVRTLGYPVSSEFPLLGKRVQLFQRQMLALETDGSVMPASILDQDVLPITRIDGLNLPPVDPDVVASAPSLDAPDYVTQAQAFINVYAPDEWNGLQVNFQTTFLSSVTCADAFGSDPCDPSQLPALDLQLWGLPTSLPTSDPLNPDFVYQRFQRGIMHYSRATGLTQGLLIGDWLKRIMIGVDLTPDISADVRSSRYFAQYAPSRPLALDRPDQLPDTSLAQAFRNDSLTVAQAQTNEPTLPANVAQTATAVALTATSLSATQTALSTQTGQPTGLTATALALTATASASASASATAPGFGAATPTPGGIISTVPVVNVGCMGDEQIWFVPRKPNIGVHVNVSVTSQRHHDARSMALTGPLDPGPVVEHEGPLGFIWTWTVVPTVESFYQFTFYADGLRPCITSGFNAYAPLGATATATNTPIPTNTPGTATATATATLLPVPTISDQRYDNLACGQTLTIHGNNFGTPPSANGTFATLVVGSRSFQMQTVGTGSNTQLRVILPSSGVTTSATPTPAPFGTTPVATATPGPVSGSIFVSTSQSDSNSVPATFSQACP